MRQLIALGLTVCLATPAGAQTEVIIRRGGQPDQVIHLDSTRTKEALAKGREELRKAVSMMDQRMVELNGKLRAAELEDRAEIPTRTTTLALKNGEMAVETMLAPMMRSLATMRRPHLGVVVDQAPRETDKFGAYISAVSPGGPAEKAGILSGDIITRIAGKSLTEKIPNDDSGPGVRLISIIGTLTVGKPVEVELRRGTVLKTVKVTPDESVTMAEPSIAEISRLPVDRIAQALTFNNDVRSRAMTQGPGINVFTGPSGNFTYSFDNNEIFASYELAPLNEKLGAYFGATEGVLVVNNHVLEERVATGGAAAGAAPMRIRDLVDTTRAMPRQGNSAQTAPRASAGAPGNPQLRVDTVRISGRVDGVPMQGAIRAMPLPTRQPINIGLEPGDVIVSVDGRKVSNPSQLMRIVRSYDHNDEFKLQIMRQKHAETLTVKIP